MTRSRLIIVGIVACSLVGAIGMLLSARATSVDIANAHLAADALKTSPAVAHLPPGKTSIYFDFTVTQPDRSCATQVTVEVFHGGIRGAPTSSQMVDSAFCQTGTFGAPMQPDGGGTWMPGGYCLIVTVDSVRDDFGGKLPLAFTVGSGHVPNCRAKR